MEWLFTSLNHALDGSPAMAIAAAAAWGVLSIVLSPCHLASIPLIVGFIDGQGRISGWRAFSISALFAAGILLTIAAVGVMTAAAGRLIGDTGAWANYVVALLLFLLGLHLLDVIQLPFGGPGQVRFARHGALAALVLGLLFGIALGPCSFAFMAPMLAVAFKVGGSNAASAMLLLLAFGLGHCAVIVVAGTSTGLVQRYLAWTERSGGTLVVRRACGVLVLLGGVYLIHIAR